MSQPIPRPPDPAPRSASPGSPRPDSLPPDLAAALHDEPDSAALAALWHTAGRVPRLSEERIDTWGEAVRVRLEAALDATDAAAEPLSIAEPMPRTRADRSHGSVRVADRPSSSRPARPRRFAWPVAATVLTALLLVVGLRWHGAQPVALAAAPGTTESVVLPDGSRVTLAAGASLTYDRAFASGDALEDAEALRAVALTGEAFFEVEHGAAPFRVTTEAASVTVLGTAFGVRAEGGQTQVALESGSVRMRASRSGRALTLAPGAVAVAQADSVALTSARVADMLAWRTGGFAFVDQPLGRIAEDVALRYGVNIAVQPERLRDRPYTLILDRPEGPEAVLSDLAEYAGLTLQKQPGGFVLTEAR